MPNGQRSHSTARAQHGHGEVQEGGSVTGLWGVSGAAETGPRRPAEEFLKES
jgi:hypothetical protein